MNTRQHLVVIDPIAFPGGSKVATENILALLPLQGTRVTILSADRKAWQHPGWRHVRLFELPWLARREQGLGYFARHLWIGMQLLLLRLRHGRIDTALGASGPGVDLALYLARGLLRYRVVQLVHGPVARSRTIARCLLRADQVHYLPSTRDTLVDALASIRHDPQLDPSRFQVMLNGLPERAWPSPCQYRRPAIFWAASLLKWKGLDTLLAAIEQTPQQARALTTICYIRPRDTALPTSKAPVDLARVRWYQAPPELDALRADANIFVSTSEHEPFGLSILEAMAAGHCVLIPSDGAYWDRELHDGIDCIKYRPGDSSDLAVRLAELCVSMDRVRQIGLRAAEHALAYRAEACYADIVRSLQASRVKPGNAQTRTKAR